MLQRQVYVVHYRQGQGLYHQPRHERCTGGTRLLAEGDGFLSNNPQKTSIVEADLTSSPPSRIARHISERTGIPNGLSHVA